MMHVFVICPFYPVELNETSKIFISSNMFKSGWNWNLKFGFLRKYDQKTIFQTKWIKNMDKLKIYLTWFSSTVWREQFALEFFTQNIWKEDVTQNIYVIFTSFQFKIIYMNTFGQFCVVSGLVCVALFFYNKTQTFG